MSSTRWVGLVVALTAVSVVGAPIPAAAQGVTVATATAISPTRGPIEGGTAVTVSGTGFAPGVTRVLLTTLDTHWQKDVPASAVTVNTDGTEASFVMPKGPSKGGQVGAVMYTPSGRAEGTPIFEYPPPAAVTLPVASGMAPRTGTAGTVVTITGTAIADDGVWVLLHSVRNGSETRLMPAVLTFDEEETAVSFTMPEIPSGGGPLNVFVVYRGLKPANGLRFDYAAGTGPQARVATDATDVASSSSSSSSSPVLFAVAMGVLVAGWAAFVVGTRRRTSRTT